MVNVGKGSADRVLDGWTWDQLPRLVTIETQLWAQTHRAGALWAGARTCPLAVMRLRGERDTEPELERPLSPLSCPAVPSARRPQAACSHH